MTQPALIFDLGTTYFKAALLTGRDEFIAVVHVPTPITHPQADRSEMAVKDFLDAIGQLMADLQRQSPRAYQQIQHISFATQANTFVLLDEAFEPVTSFIVWDDRRAEAVVLPMGNAYHLTGLPELGVFNAPKKLQWIQQNMPEIWEKSHYFCFLSDYLTYCFTGKFVTEAGVAGLSGMVDIHRLCWLKEMMDVFGANALHFPDIQRAGTSLGTITTAASVKYQLNPDCRFTLGCLDQYAGVLAADLLGQDGICETTGTVLATVRSAPNFDASLQQYHIYQGPSPHPDFYFRMLFTDVSAKLLAVFRKEYTPELSYEALDAMASQLPITDTSVELLDFDLNEPWFEFSGDTMKLDTAHQVQAIYYKVAKSLKKQIKIHYPDVSPIRVRSLGGGANSAHWLGIKAHVLGIDVLAIQSEKPTCLGAYRLINKEISS